ncbi:MAG: ParB N-terminal domain-containing protein, partial [Thermodesulfobacteriota bacterium]
MSEPARKMKTEGTNGVRGGRKKANPAELHLADRLAEARGRRTREGAAAAPATVEELAPESARDLAFLPWNVIDRSPLNPRRHFAPEPLEELAESIVTAGGVKQSLLVRPRPDLPGSYWLIAGERRHRAVGLLVEAGRLPVDVALPVRVEAGCDDARHL